MESARSSGSAGVSLPASGITPNLEQVENAGKGGCRRSTLPAAPGRR
jgi:hypothetical protein